MTQSVRATILIPTHDHGLTLVHSVGSALAQTVEAIEVFIIGDGVPESAREFVMDLCHRDKRVRFFDNPKGPRHGEIYRHAALAEARGRIVCYLADDDLWLPHHVESLEQLLGEAEFANTSAASILPDQSIFSHLGDLAFPDLRARMAAGENFVPLSCGGHQLVAYRQLPFGWRTTPVGVPTDLYMWQQFLGQPTVRCRTSGEMTVLHFPSSLRPGWSPEDRLAELEHWSHRISGEGFREELLDAKASFFRHETLRLLVSAVHRERHVAQLEERTAALDSRNQNNDQALARSQEELVECRRAAEVVGAELRASEESRRAQDGQCRELEAQLAATVRAAEFEKAGRRAVEAELARTRATLTWRLRARLLRLRTVRLLLRMCRR